MGQDSLVAGQENYKQFHTTLPGTKEVHVLALPLSANIAEGMLHPPDIPKPKEEQASSSPPIQTAQVDLTRFVLGNWDEDTPHLRSFLGHLHAMRVIFLHRHEHPDTGRDLGFSIVEAGTGARSHYATRSVGYQSVENDRRPDALEPLDQRRCPFRLAPLARGVTSSEQTVCENVCGSSRCAQRECSNTLTSLHP